MKRQRVRSEIYRARRFKLKAARRARRDASRVSLVDNLHGEMELVRNAPRFQELCAQHQAWSVEFDAYIHNPENDCNQAGFDTLEAKFAPIRAELSALRVKQS